MRRLPWKTEAPRWLEDPSPWGIPWGEIVERAAWWELFPQEPPFREASPLRLRVLRADPRDVPRVLLGEEPWPRNLLTSPLARLMDAGPEALARQAREVSAGDVEALLERLEALGEGKPSGDVVPLGPRDLVTLVAPAAQRLRSRIVDLAARWTRRAFGGRILLYAPLYLSNVCTNRCVYCGFNFDNPVTRKTLTLEEIRREAEALASRGIRHVLLLTGEAPKAVGVGYLEEAVHAVKDLFETISLEVFPMSEEEYGRLVAAGVTGLTLYQETYDPVLYHEVHRGGRKRNILWRLGAPERAARAGMARVGIGSLLGLGDWRFETVALGLHGRGLLRLFPGLFLTVSFPRLRHAPGEYRPPRPVSDEELVHMMAVLRLFLPESGLVLSTRESAGLRDRLAPLFVTQMSAGSSTTPGGYAMPWRDEAPAQQFDIEDRRSPAEVTRRLREMGLEIV
jgi:2-iminoacetate synthase